MTTKSGARIYRGPSIDPLADGACPHCHRVISITRHGRRRHHQDSDGLPCTGGGVTVGAADEYALDDLPDVNIPAKSYLPQASRSEQPPTLAGRAGVLYEGRSDRIAANGRAVCPSCSRHLPLNSDGTIRRHRTRHQDPLAPYCEATP